MNFRNPYSNKTPKEMFLDFYRYNKVLTYMIIGTLALLIATGNPILGSIFVTYFVYFGGVLLRQFYSENNLLKIFAIASLGGALFYLMLFGKTIVYQNLIYATISSGAISLIAAAAAAGPNTELMLAFFGRVKTKWLALIIIGLDVMTINPKYPSLRVCDIAGITLGFGIVWLQKNHGLNLFKKRGPYVKKQKKSTGFTEARARKETDEDFNARKKIEQAEIDSILDKIKKSGYDSLTADEKRKLFEKSNS